MRGLRCWLIRRSLWRLWLYFLPRWGLLRGDRRQRLRELPSGLLRNIDGLSGVHRLRCGRVLCFTGSQLLALPRWILPKRQRRQRLRCL